MAGKRIYKLPSTDTPPEAAFLPLDADGLTSAMAISPKDLVDAASYTITVVLSNDALTNRNNLIDALNAYAASGNKRGTLKLPKGIYQLADNVTLTAAHSGLTIDGDGCSLYRATGFTAENSVININLSTLLDPMGRGDGFNRVAGNPKQFQFPVLPAPQPRYPNYQVGDAIILFKTANLPNTRQAVQQVAVITAKDVLNRTITVDADLIPEVNAATYLFNGRKLQTGGVIAGATSLTIPGMAAATLFSKQCWIYVTDGVGELETYGEFVRVEDIAIHPETLDTILTLESALRNSYLDGRAAVVPPSPDPATGLRSRWCEDITIRGLTFGGSYPHVNNADLAIKFSVNVTLDRVRHVRAVDDPNVASNGVVIVTSGHVALRECEAIPGGVALALNTVRDALIDNCRVTTSVEEFCSDITFRNCQIVRAYDHRLGIARVNAIDSAFYNLTQFSVGDDCGLYRCTFVGTATAGGSGDLGIGGNRFTVRDVQTVAGPLQLIFQAGTGHTVGRVRGSVQLLEGSAGQIDGPVSDGVSAYGPGPIPLPGTWKYTTDVQIPFTFTQLTGPVIVGHLDGLRPALWLWVHVLVTGFGVSIARTYAINRGYQYPGAWYVCWPLTEGRQRYDDTDFALELLDGPNDVWLRLRRLGVSTTPVEAIVRIESSAPFTAGGTPPSYPDPVGVHESTTVSQRNGFAYVTSLVLTTATAPADADLLVGQCGQWFDPVAKAVLFEGRDAGGTIRTASLVMN